MTRFLTYTTTAVVVEDITQVGEARRAAAELSQNLQFDEGTAGEVAIVVNELGSNLVKHAGGGQLLFNPRWDQQGSALEIVALDRGPGMANLNRCMEDGFSSSGTAGNGLGAVRRLAKDFDVLTVSGGGTAVLARMQKAAVNKCAKWPLCVGVINLPYPGEPASGDAWAVRYDDDRASVMVADGLGHGDAASDASRAAIMEFLRGGERSLVEVMQATHLTLKPTRGAAIAVGKLNLNLKQMTYCGIGNIAGSVVTLDSSKSMISHNGIVGHEARRFSEFQYDWPPDAALVMHSDGIQSQWNLGKYPGIWRRDPALIAAVIYRDFSRGRDDVTVVVGKE